MRFLLGAALVMLALARPASAAQETTLTLVLNEALELLGDPSPDSHNLSRPADILAAKKDSWTQPNELSIRLFRRAQELAAKGLGLPLPGPGQEGLVAFARTHTLHWAGMLDGLASPGSLSEATATSIRTFGDLESASTRYTHDALGGVHSLERLPFSPVRKDLISLTVSAAYDPAFEWQRVEDELSPDGLLRLVLLSRIDGTGGPVNVLLVRLADSPEEIGAVLHLAIRTESDPIYAHYFGVICQVEFAEDKRRAIARALSGLEAQELSPQGSPSEQEWVEAFRSGFEAESVEASPDTPPPDGLPERPIP